MSIFEPLSPKKYMAELIEHTVSETVKELLEESAVFKAVATKFFVSGVAVGMQIALEDMPELANELEVPDDAIADFLRHATDAIFDELSTMVRETHRAADSEVSLVRAVTEIAKKRGVKEDSIAVKAVAEIRPRDYPNKEAMLNAIADSLVRECMEHCEVSESVAEHELLSKIKSGHVVIQGPENVISQVAGIVEKRIAKKCAH